MTGPSRVVPHLRRLRERGSAAAIGEALAREARIRGHARITGARLARARSTSQPVLVGPFLGEIGFEVLYWVPFLRRLLGRHGIDSSRVTAISRGGTESWYRGVADGYVDMFDLFSAEDYGARLAGRRAQVGDSKQLTVADLDREVVSMSGGGDSLLLHPSLLFAALRYFWAGERPPTTATRQLAFEQLEAGSAPLPELPERYVAVKAYFSDCFPETPANQAHLRETVAQLAKGGDVVLLPSSFAFDDHHAPDAADLGRVHEIPEAAVPRTNLGIQTQVIAGAAGLVGTYGGFSYLAPMLGVPSATMYSEENFNTSHLTVLRSATAQLGGVDYRVEHVDRATPESMASGMWSNLGR